MRKFFKVLTGLFNSFEPKIFGCHFLSLEYILVNSMKLSFQKVSCCEQLQQSRIEKITSNYWVQVSTIFSTHDLAAIMIVMLCWWASSSWGLPQFKCDKDDQSKLEYKKIKRNICVDTARCQVYYQRSELLNVTVFACTKF